ncbi:hypothetical protein ACHAPX_008098 [Trichoderma viride]
MLYSDRTQHALALWLTPVVLYALYAWLKVITGAFFGPLSKIPGPKLWAISRLFRMYMEWQGEEAAGVAALHNKYGPVVRLAPNEVSFAGGAQAWKDIYGYRKNVGQEKHAYRSSASYWPPANGAPTMIQATRDEDHQRLRKSLAGSFSDKSMKQMEPRVKGWARLLQTKLAERGDAAVDMVELFRCATFDAMGDLALGDDLQMLRNGRLSDYVHSAFSGIRAIIRLRVLSTYNSFTRWLVRDCFLQSAFVRKAAMENLRYSADRVDRRLQDPARDPPDLWTKPLTGVDGNMSLDEYHSTAQLLMTAGTDTSAIGLSGTLYYLLTNPDCLAKVTDEVRSAFSSMDDITYEALGQQKYLDAALQEGMRLYPPVPTGAPRVTPMPGLSIGGYWIPGGVTVQVPHYATSRLPANFTAPESFHPERWLDDEKFQNDRLDAVQPFNYGPQNCLGQAFAMNEMRLFMAAVLLQFDLQLCEDEDPRAWLDQRVFSMWETKPLMCVATKTS